MTSEKSNLQTALQSNSDCVENRNVGISSSNFKDWQPTKTNVKERLSFIFNSEVFSDVHFIVGLKPETQRIPAHKVLLSAASPVFAAMFSENWNSQSNEIEVPDVEPVAFLALLRYFYTDEVQITVENVTSVLYAAKKYIAPWLENHCLQFLFKVLCPENAFYILSQTKFFADKQLLTDCLETIDKNTEAAVSADYFCDTELEVLCMVLERDSLNISEIKLFEAVKRWSEAECKRKNLVLNAENQKMVLEKVLPLIRFPLMSVKQFAEKVATSEILLEKDVISLFQYFSDNKIDVTFSKTRRICDEDYIAVRRFQCLVYDPSQTNEKHMIGFFADRNFILHGLGLYGSLESADYQISISLFDLKTKVSVGKSSTKVKYSFSESSQSIKVLFKDPIKLKSETKYYAVAEIKGCATYYGENGEKAMYVCLPKEKRLKLQFFNVLTLKCYNGDCEDCENDEDFEEYENYEEIDYEDYDKITTFCKGQIPDLLISID